MSTPLTLAYGEASPEASLCHSVSISPREDAFHTPTRPFARQGTPSQLVDITPGALVGGRYRVARFVGAGATGEVFEATHEGTGRRVALKVLRNEFTNLPEVEARLRIEAEATTRVAHPNTVMIFDLGRDDTTGRLYLAAEFLDGETLRTRLDRVGRLSLGEAVASLWPVMDALGVAHANAITHRDIKPENIFLVRGRDEAEMPKIIDFGLARAERGDASRLTAAGYVLGTPTYMSPEQARGEDVDARTDVWAMGVLWYETLSGVSPFDGDSFPEVFYHVFMVDPPRLDTLHHEIPSAVADVVQRALSKLRGDRFQTMQAFIEAMAAALPSTLEAPRGRWSLAPRTHTSLPKVALRTDAPQSAMPDAPSTDRATKRARLMIAFAAAFLTTVFTLIAARFLR